MYVLGIDPSINSTGVCLIDDENQNFKPIYWLIPSKPTKKLLNVRHERLTILPYEKNSTKDKIYSEKEYIKLENINGVCNNILYIIKLYDIQKINMEGISYGSVGSAALADLAGLNFCIRKTIYDYNSKILINIIAPTSVKAIAVGSGQATKDIMIDAWKRLDPEMKDLCDNGYKIDDLADAYFISLL